MTAETPTCSVPDCDRPTQTRGWCRRHYMRWRQHGHPTEQDTPTVCVATTRAGEPCKGKPIDGGTVCYKHGGQIGQVREAARKRVMERQADRQLERIWVGLNRAKPVTDPVESMARLAGSLENAVDQVGERVNALSELGDAVQGTSLRADVVLLERLLGQLRQTLDSMVKLGIEERRVAFQQAQVEALTAVFGRALSVAGVPDELAVVVRGEVLAGLRALEER